MSPFTHIAAAAAGYAIGRHATRADDPEKQPTDSESDQPTPESGGAATPLLGPNLLPFVSIEKDHPAYSAPMSMQTVYLQLNSVRDEVDIYLKQLDDGEHIVLHARERGCHACSERALTDGQLSEFLMWRDETINSADVTAGLELTTDEHLALIPVVRDNEGGNFRVGVCESLIWLLPAQWISQPGIGYFTATRHNI